MRLLPVKLPGTVSMDAESAGKGDVCLGLLQIMKTKVGRVHLHTGKINALGILSRDGESRIN